MVSGVLKLLLRQLLRQKTYTALALGGLTVGLAAALSVGIYIYRETDRDSFFDDRYYRVGLEANFSDRHFQSALSTYDLAPELNTVAGVNSTARLFISRQPVTVSIDLTSSSHVKQTGLMLADSNFFSFFPFTLKHGRPETALRQPTSVVISTSLAHRLFNTTGDVTGKLIYFDTLAQAYTVTGVADAAPENSHIQFDVILPWSSFPAIAKGGWMANSIYTYVKVDPTARLETVEAELDKINTAKLGPALEAGLNKSYHAFKASGGIYRYFLYPIKSTYLRTPELGNDFSEKSNIRNVNVALIIGLIILVACSTNYANFLVFRTIARSKHVGVQLAFGLSRRMLGIRLSLQSLALLVASLVVALILAALSLPFFSFLLDTPLHLAVILQPLFAVTAIGILMLIALLTGYAPLLLGRSNHIFNPTSRSIPEFSHVHVTGVIVMLQYIVLFTICFLTVHIALQLRYLTQQRDGMDPRNVVVLLNITTLGENGPAFRAKLEDLEGFESSATTVMPLPLIHQNLLLRTLHDKSEHFFAVMLAQASIEDVLQLKILKGGFYTDSPSEKSCVINEAAADELNMTLGDQIYDVNQFTQDTLTVKGIIKNFPFDDYQSEIRPMVIRPFGSGSVLMVRHDEAAPDFSQTVRVLWNKYANPGTIELNRLEGLYASLLSEQFRLESLFTLLLVVMLAIALSGLITITLLRNEIQAKSTALRRIMGASTWEVVRTILYRNAKAILISMIISLLPAWWLINLWLEEFAHHIELAWGWLAMTAAIVFVLSITSIAFASLRTLRTNPTDVLRNE